MKFDKWLPMLALTAAMAPGIATATVSEQDFQVRTA